MWPCLGQGNATAALRLRRQPMSHEPREILGDNPLYNHTLSLGDDQQEAETVGEKTVQEEEEGLKATDLAYHQLLQEC